MKSQHLIIRLMMICDLVGESVCASCFCYLGWASLFIFSSLTVRSAQWNFIPDCFTTSLIHFSLKTELGCRESTSIEVFRRLSNTWSEIEKKTKTFFDTHQLRNAQISRSSLFLTAVFVHGGCERRHRHPLRDLHFLLVHISFDLGSPRLLLMTLVLKICDTVRVVRCWHELRPNSRCAALIGCLC